MSLSTRFVPADVVGYDAWSHLYLLTDGRLMPAELVGLSNKERRARIKAARLTQRRLELAHPLPPFNPSPQEVIEHVQARMATLGVPALRPPVDMPPWLPYTIRPIEETA